MALDFNFAKTGLSVSLRAIITDNPVNLLWDFGDGNSQNIDPTDPSIENPYKINHVYEDSGFYNITLTVTLAEEPHPDPISKTIGVADVDFNPLDKPISSLLTGFLPGGIDFQEGFVQVPDLLLKWQLFLFPLVNVNIEDNNYNNELYWPPLVNYLIAYLIAYDLIIIASQKYLIGLGVETGSSQSGLEVKSIRTGPAEAEWFQGSETWGEVFKEGGSFDVLKENICNLSHRLRITLEICRNLDHSSTPPSVHRKPKKTRYSNPFTRNKL